MLGWGGTDVVLDLLPLLLINITIFFFVSVSLENLMCLGGGGGGGGGGGNVASDISKSVILN